MDPVLTHLIKARALEQKKPETPERRIAIHSIEAAVVLIELAEKTEQKRISASSPNPTAR